MVITLVIIVVLGLIAYFYKASKNSNQEFDKENLDIDPDRHLENIVQSELDKYALNRKEKIPFMPEKCWLVLQVPVEDSIREILSKFDKNPSNQIFLFF